MAENPTQIVYDFLTEVMMLSDVDKKDILIAHRMVPESPDKGGRLMVVRCTPELKSQILGNTKVLAKKTNALDQAYYVNQQLSEASVAIRKEYAHKIKKIHKENKGKPPKLRTQYRIQNKKLYIDGYTQEKLIKPPTIPELLPDNQEQEKMEKFKFWY